MHALDDHAGRVRVRDCRFLLADLASRRRDVVHCWLSSISGVSFGPNTAPAFSAEQQPERLLAGPLAARARPLWVFAPSRIEAQLGGDADSGKLGNAGASPGLDETLEMDDER